MDKILGIKIDNLSREEILERISSFLISDKCHQVVTVNPEFILTAQKDKTFADIINDSDLAVADGAGLKFAFWRLGKKLKARFAGADLMGEILKIASEKNLGVFLVAKEDGLSTWEETAGAIRKIYPKLKISGLNLSVIERSLAESTRLSSILFVNFGSPEQEKFIFLNREKFAKIRLAMGVGGSFDYLTGKIKRAPSFLRWLGLEWLWRLIQQPKRIGRIFRAVVVFPILVLFRRN